MIENKISQIIRKDQEISVSIQNHTESLVLFSIFCFISVPNAMKETNILTVLVGVFSTLILIISLIGLIELKILQRKLLLYPDKSYRKKVRQPILYQSIFWYLPR